MKLPGSFSEFIDELELDKLILNLRRLCGFQGGYPLLLGSNSYGPELRDLILQRHGSLYKSIPKSFHLATIWRLDVSCQKIIFDYYYNRNEAETALASKLKLASNAYYPSRIYEIYLYFFRLY